MNQPIDDNIDASALRGVSETALLTLNGRAHQAGLPGAILHDPMAIKLRDSIDFDYDKFGRKGQEMALRSLAVDGCALNGAFWTIAGASTDEPLQLTVTDTQTGASTTQLLWNEFSDSAWVADTGSLGACD